MTKKNKIIIIFAVLFAVVMLILGIFLIEQHMRKTDVDSAKEQSLEYLCEKYNANPQEFKLIKYNQAHSEEEEYEIFLTKTVWIDFSFEYEYNNRHFIVSKNKKGYYDDYQFDDIQNWCTEWLQENVDNRITGVILDTRDILYYSSTTKKGYKYVITKAETENFLKNYKSVNDVKIFNYYDINGPVNHGIDEELNQKITFKIGNGVDCSADYSEKIITKEIDKSRFINWSSWYTVLSSIGE